MKKHFLLEGVIPSCRFNSSSLDVIRLLHDMVMAVWDEGEDFWMVSDDVVHAYIRIFESCDCE